MRTLRNNRRFLHVDTASGRRILRRCPIPPTLRTGVNPGAFGASPRSTPRTGTCSTRREAALRRASWRVADHQTAGRGRFERRWEAPPGSSLLVSVLLRPAVSEALHAAVMAVALALAGAVEDVAGISARGQVAERPRGGRPQARRAPGRARRRRARDRCGLQRRVGDVPSGARGHRDRVQPRGRAQRRPRCAARAVPRAARSASSTRSTKSPSATAPGSRHSAGACASNVHATRWRETRSTSPTTERSSCVATTEPTSSSPSATSSTSGTP